jgi:hypothetical protein
LSGLHGLDRDLLKSACDSLEEESFSYLNLKTAIRDVVDAADLDHEKLKNIFDQYFGHLIHTTDV